MKIRLFILFIVFSITVQGQFSVAKRLLLAQGIGIDPIGCVLDSSGLTGNAQILGYLDTMMETDSLAADFAINYNTNKVYILWMYYNSYPVIRQYSFYPNQQPLLIDDGKSFNLSYYSLYISFNSSFSELYVQVIPWDTGNYIRKHELSIAGDISTASITNEELVLPRRFRGFSISGNNQYLYTGVGHQSEMDTVFQYVIDINNFENSYLDVFIVDDYGGETSPIKFVNDIDGLNFYVGTSNHIIRYKLGSAYDIGTILSRDSDTPPLAKVYFESFSVNPNNTRMYSIEITSGEGSNEYSFIEYDITCEEPIPSLSCPNPLIVDTASVGTFQMAHSLITDGIYIYAGERINDATPDSISRIIKYNPSTLSEIDAYEVGPNMDVESMAYDANANRIYATQIYDDGTTRCVSIMRINPSNMTLIDTTVYFSLLSRNSFPIVTDGEYIYGTTYAASPQFFKIRISDMSLVAINAWPNAIRAHAATIDVDNGVMYVSCIMYDWSDRPRFAKVNLSDLSFTDVDIGSYVRKATDDFAMIKEGNETYCYVGGEFVSTVPGENNYGYGGVRIKTSDMSLTGINLKITYALGAAGNYIYNTTIDGNIQIFHKDNLSDVVTCNLNGFFGNEFISLGGYGYITNFQSYNKSRGKLIRIGLIE